jgi:hypothetical protein
VCPIIHQSLHRHLERSRSISYQDQRTAAIQPPVYASERESLRVSHHQPLQPTCAEPGTALPRAKDGPACPESSLPPSSRPLSRAEGDENDAHACRMSRHSQLALAQAQAAAGPDSSSNRADSTAAPQRGSRGTIQPLIMMTARVISRRSRRVAARAHCVRERESRAHRECARSLELAQVGWPAGPRCREPGNRIRCEVAAAKSRLPVRVSPR